MKYKLIGMDFDGTLLNDDKKITNVTKRVIKSYKDNGYIIVGVTARNLGSVKNICDINLFNYLILNNGGYTYDVQNKKGYEESELIKKDIICIDKEVQDISEKIDYCSSTTYYSLMNEEIKEKSFIKKINNIDDIPEKILRMNIFVKDETKINSYKNNINKKFPNVECFIMQDSNDTKKWLVINPKNTNKATTLKRLGDSLNIKSKEMIFFGDGPNDLEVIQFVGLGIAMKNAIDKIKEASKAVTLSNNEDGIAIFLKQNIK